MSDSNGLEGNACKWCGHHERLPGNEYCSPDCYYTAHDSHQLHQVYCNDRESLQRALRGLNATMAELNRSLHEDGLDGENAHTALRQAVDAIKLDTVRIGEQIQDLSLRITEIERLF